MLVGGTGGCDFATPPTRTAREITAFWAPEVDPAVVILTAIPASLPPEIVESVTLLPGEVRRATDGLYSAHGMGLATAYSVLLGNSQPDGPLAAVIPLGSSVGGRFAASRRLWRMTGGLPSPDTRLTRQRRRRLRDMLRAVDGHIAHASHRQIAEAIFGKRRVAAELWHESSLRYATMRLLRDGRAMVDGGYRNLLRSRRAP